MSVSVRTVCVQVCMCVCPLATCPSHFQRPGFDKAPHSVEEAFEADVCEDRQRERDRQSTVQCNAC